MFLHFLEVSIIQSHYFFKPKIFKYVHKYTFSIHATMLEQHSESDWHRSSSQFSIWFHQEDNSHILKTPIFQYIIKISSVSQNIKPDVLEYQ